MSSSKNIEYAKTAFLSKTNSAFIEEMYSKFANNDPSLPQSWKNYFDEIGDEFDVIINEINGPSWSPSKKISIDKIEKKQLNELEIIKSNANSIKAVAMIRDMSKTAEQNSKALDNIEKENESPKEVINKQTKDPKV